MGKQLKLYPVLVDDLFPVILFGFGYNRNEAIKRITNKFPQVNEADSIRLMNPLQINTSVIFAIDAELDLLVNINDIKGCLDYEKLIDEDGFLIPLDEDNIEVIEVEKEEKKTDGKDKGKQAKWA